MKLTNRDLLIAHGELTALSGGNTNATEMKLMRTLVRTGPTAEALQARLRAKAAEYQTTGDSGVTVWTDEAAYRREEDEILALDSGVELTETFRPQEFKRAVGAAFARLIGAGVMVQVVEEAEERAE